MGHTGPSPANTEIVKGFFTDGVGRRATQPRPASGQAHLTCPPPPLGLVRPVPAPRAGRNLAPAAAVSAAILAGSSGLPARPPRAPVPALLPGPPQLGGGQLQHSPRAGLAPSPRLIRPGEFSPLPSGLSRWPAQPLPAVAPALESLQTQRFGLLDRDVPQVPVEFEHRGHVVRRHFATSLDPDAAVFVPANPWREVEETLAACPEVWEAVMAEVDPVETAQIPETARPQDCSCHGRRAGSCPTFLASFINTVVRVRAHGVPNVDGARIVLADSHIDPAPWSDLLQGYFDRETLVSGLLFGWDFSTLPDPQPRDAPRNHPSAMDFPEAVDEYVDTECSFSALAGPLPNNLPFKTFRNPLGTVPKAGGKRRIIVDCTQAGRGINEWIPADQHRGKPAKVKLPTSEDICNAIARTRLRFPGQKIFLYKCDFSRYYRQFCACPSHAPFFCFEWRGSLYIDRAWSFGNRGACLASQKYSEAVCWAFRTRVPPSPDTRNSGLACHCAAPCHCGDNIAAAYIDDGIGVAPEQNATWLFNAFVGLVTSLTLSLSSTPGHIMPPSSCCVALGIKYDTINNVVSLPEDKLVALTLLLQEWSGRLSASAKDLATLSGKLLWAAAVVPPGRTFLGRILATKRFADSAGPALARRPIPLDEEIKKDLRWWAVMLRRWNGRSFLQPVLSGDVALDASSGAWFGGGPGVGAYSFISNEFFCTGVPLAMSSWPISDLELLGHVLCCRVWGHKWAGASVSILTDNESCRHLLEKGRSRNPRRLAMARILVQCQFHQNFRVRSDRISTSQNILADRLSRMAQPNAWAEFLEEVSKSSGATPVRISVPDSAFDISGDW